MLEQLETTLEVFTSKIKQLKALNKENQDYLKEAIEYGETPQSEVDDRMRLAKEYHKMLKIAKVEKKYFEENYYNKYKRNYSNIPIEIANFLKQFFMELKMKTIGFSEARYLSHTIKDVEKHPFLPKKNCIVSFEIENSTFYVIYTDYKIELSEWVSDRQEYSNDSYQAHLFKYELEGYSEIIGDFSAFRYAILSKLKNVKVTDISISEEE